MKKNLFKICILLIPKTGKSAFRLGFVLCLIVCLLIIWVLAPLTGISKSFGPGHDGYIQLAEQLGRSNGYVFKKNGPPVFHRPPLYPFLLVPVALLPETIQRPALILIQSLMVGCICALIFTIAKRLFSVETAGISVIIFLINPWVYWNAKNPMTPILQTLLYSLFFLLVLRQITYGFNPDGNNKTKTVFWKPSIIAGITAGALILTHAAMLAVSLVWLALIFITGLFIKNRGLLTTSATSTIIIVIIVAPWTYRNWITFNRFIPVASGVGLAYFNGNVHWKGICKKPQQEGETYIDASLRVLGIEGTEETRTHWKGFKNIKLDEKANKKMLQDIKSNPLAFIKKVFLNTLEYYFPALAYPFLAIKNISVEKTAITIFNSLLWSLAIFGIIQERKKENNRFSSLILLAGIFLYAIWFLPFATFIGHYLYALGTIPILSILAAKGLSVLYPKPLPENYGRT